MKSEDYILTGNLSFIIFVKFTYNVSHNFSGRHIISRVLISMSNSYYVFYLGHCSATVDEKNIKVTGI